jgi:hypothetical protein
MPTAEPNLTTPALDHLDLDVVLWRGSLALGVRLNSRTYSAPL